VRELAAVVVVHGPGSFTGVRVGLSAAKGLSEAGGVPLVAVSRLALLAALSGGWRRSGACGAGCGAG
jgi:tRNA threonylcarbamoyladenosine biosynthesis protein TsaB